MIRPVTDSLLHIISSPVVIMGLGIELLVNLRKCSIRTADIVLDANGRGQAD